MMESPLPIPGGINHYYYQKNAIFCSFMLLFNMAFFSIFISNPNNSVNFFRWR